MVAGQLDVQQEFRLDVDRRIHPAPPNADPDSDFID
jgi:hypothetical protein